MIGRRSGGYRFAALFDAVTASTGFATSIARVNAAAPGTWMSGTLPVPMSWDKSERIARPQKKGQATANLLMVRSAQAETIDLGRTLQASNAIYTIGDNENVVVQQIAEYEEAWWDFFERHPDIGGRYIAANIDIDFTEATKQGGLLLVGYEAVLTLTYAAVDTTLWR